MSGLILGKPVPRDLESLAALLSTCGFIAAEEEARELRDRASGDVELLASLVRRRLTGEPLAWVIGSTLFCDLRISVHPGVYVPRWQSEPLARRAIALLPHKGTAIDVCTGTGAVAKVLTTRRPSARVVASDLDGRAVACAAANGVEVYQGDLFEPLPRALVGVADLVIGVVPYVPTGAMATLQRDTFTFESTMAYDGGPDGTRLLNRVMRDSREFLRPRGAVLLELGGGQVEAVKRRLSELGYIDHRVLVDEDGDARGIESRLGLAHPRSAAAMTTAPAMRARSRSSTRMSERESPP